MTRLFAVSAFSFLVLSAQDNPLSNEARQAWTRTRGNLVAAAEKMSDDGFAFKPTPESMSFQELVAHTADSAMAACSAVNGERKQAGAASKSGKADLVAALQAAMAECDTAYGSINDAKASEIIEGRRGRSSRLGALYQNTIHMEHEYAQMAVHLRLKGVVPPSTANRGPMGGGKKK